MRSLHRRAPAPIAVRITVIVALVAAVLGVGVIESHPAQAAGVSVTSTSTGNASARTVITLDRPAGTAPGDVMLASVASQGVSHSFSAPDGWTLVREDGVGNAVHQAIYYRVATESEPASHAWTLPQKRRMAGGITAYAGVDPARPVDAHGASTHPDAGAAVTAPSITTTVPGTVLVHFAAIGAEGTLTPPPGMTERWEAESPEPTNPHDVLVSSSDADHAPAGPTGPRTATASRPGPAIGVAVALRPADVPAEVAPADTTATEEITASEEPTVTAAASEEPSPAEAASATEEPTTTDTAEVAVVGSAWSQSSDGAHSVTVNRPPGTQAEHVMVATVAVTGDSTAIATPAGWTRLRDDRGGNFVGQAVFVRVATATEPASYTFDLSGKPQVAAGITTYSGVEASDPVEAHDALTQEGTSVTAPSLVAGSAGARLLHLTAANVEGSVTPPAGMTERFEANSPHPKNHKDVLVALADEAVSAAGATGTRTATVSPAGPSVGAAILLRLAGTLPEPPPDTTAPETTIDSGPPDPSGSSSASFSFSANEPVLTFRCRLDGGTVEDCSSPKSYSGLANGTHSFAVAAVDLAGNVDGSPATWTWTVQVDTTTEAVLVGAGDIASCHNDNDESTAQLVDTVVAEHPQAGVFTTGDNVYDSGTTAEFNDCYHPTWGRHKERTRPAPGNHEYGTAGAAGYFGYFGAAAGAAGQGYYDYMEGGWHVVVLNSQCNAVGGCHAGSAQEQWLRARLAEVAAECTVAMWHHPLYSSGTVHGSNPTYQPFWQALYDHGAELVLNGHDHVYERFAPQTPGGVLDEVYGLPQITTGLGGRSRYGFSTVAPNSLVRNSADYGVLKLTLRAGGYDFEQLRLGGAVVDSGTGTCHDAPVVEPPPPPVDGPIDAVGSSSSGSPKTQAALTVARPAGVVAGHVMVANIVSNDNDPGFIAPGGWTLLSDLTAGSDLRQAVYYKVATDSEPTSYTWALDAETTRRIAGGLTAYSGVDTANPVDVHGASIQTTATTSVPAPSITTTVGETLLIHLAAVNAEGTITPPDGMTERWEAASPNSKNDRDALAAMADMGIAEAGATGIRIATVSVAGPNIGVALALRPAPTGS